LYRLFIQNNFSYYVVLYKVVKGIFYIADPAIGYKEYDESQMTNKWIIEDDKGIVIDALLNKKSISEKEIVKPNPITDLSLKKSNTGNLKISFSTLYKKLFKFKSGISQIIVILFIGALIQLVVPFLTQAIVDTGISNQDINFIYLILLSQFMLFISSTTLDFLRSWILLHIGVRINIDLVVSFVQKLLRQDLTYFDSRKEGDILQRVIDNNRIESFLTNTTMQFLIAILNLFLFGIILFIYDISIFKVFLVSTILLIGWISFFLKRRKQLDNQRFTIFSKNRSELIELIHGVEDIKLNNLEIDRLDKWEGIQKEYLTIRLKMLQLNQIQRGGAIAINQGKNVFITFLSATAVLSGNLTLGAMLAIQYIVGQLNSPVRDIASFIQSYQDAQLSLERISDLKEIDKSKENGKLLSRNQSYDIELENINLTINDTNILKNIDLNIPKGSTIGIVGKSGSGKTSLLKIILKLLPPTNGIIKLNNQNLESIDTNNWNEKISVVMQDSHIFSSSIKYNITLQDDDSLIDFEHLEKAITLSCLSEIMTDLPFGLETQIGRGGKRFSKGQLQRIFIARAIYKNGDVFILDEFTSALDSITERKIMKNIYDNFSDRTLIFVAHKLKTLSKADHIFVLVKGKIFEQGTHETLMKNQQLYFKMYSKQNKNT